jgi:hypothetical protein
VLHGDTVEKLFLQLLCESSASDSPLDCIQLGLVHDCSRLQLRLFEAPQAFEQNFVPLRRSDEIRPAHCEHTRISEDI